MTLSIDTIELDVPDPAAAGRFYEEVFAATGKSVDGHVRLAFHDVAHLELHPRADADVGSGVGRVVLNYIVPQPAEVSALVAAAADAGATVLKPARRGLFGGFTGVVQAPDGAVWKIAAPTRKDTGPAGSPPRPTEVVAILGVADPRASKGFYEAAGMTADRDYGAKFVDFSFAAGAWRLGLMPVKDLVKDAGLTAVRDISGPASGRWRLTTRASSSDEVNEVRRAVDAAGGTPGPDRGDAYAVRFTDLDDHQWRVACH